MDTSDFYVTLSSNVQNSEYDNTIGNFVTQLPAPLILDSQWRVAVTEIHYTNSWCNLRSDNSIKIKPAFTLENTVFNAPAYMPAGRYDDIEGLIDEITARLQVTKSNNVQRLPKLEVNHFNRRLRMIHGISSLGMPLTLEFDSELSEMLGVSSGYRSSLAHQIVTLSHEIIDVNPPESEDEVYEANRAYDLTGGTNSLFVYSDIVDYSVVGDTKAQLLRMVHVPASSAFGTSVVDRYENPYYLPLSTKEINSIEVDIKDDTNTPIGFEFGRVKIVLHFARNGRVL